MPDIFGASGQFSIDALGQQNQNALNNAYGSGGFGGTVGQYAPYPMFGGPIASGSATDGPSVFQTGAQSFSDYGLGSRGSPYGGYNPYSPQSYAPQTPSWYGGGGGAFGGGGASGSWNSSSYGGGGGAFGGGGDPNYIWRGPDPLTPAQYAQFVAGGGQSGNPGYGGMSGGVSQVNMGAAPSPPALGSMGPPTNPSHGSYMDPFMTQMPDNNALGLGGTRDQNILNPNLPSYWQNLPAQSGQRDQIASAIMDQWRPQVALGVS